MEIGRRTTLLDASWGGINALPWRVRNQPDPMYYILDGNALAMYSRCTLVKEDGSCAAPLAAIAWFRHGHWGLGLGFPKSALPPGGISLWKTNIDAVPMEVRTVKNDTQLEIRSRPATEINNPVGFEISPFGVFQFRNGSLIPYSAEIVSPGFDPFKGQADPTQTRTLQLRLEAVTRPPGAASWVPEEKAFRPALATAAWNRGFPQPLNFEYPPFASNPREYYEAAVAQDEGLRRFLADRPAATVCGLRWTGGEGAGSPVGRTSEFELRMKVCDVGRASYSSTVVLERSTDVLGSISERFTVTGGNNTQGECPILDCWAPLDQPSPLASELWNRSRSIFIEAAAVPRMVRMFALGNQTSIMFSGTFERDSGKLYEPIWGVDLAYDAADGAFLQVNVPTEVIERHFVNVTRWR